MANGSDSLTCKLCGWTTEAFDGNHENHLAFHTGYCEMGLTDNSPFASERRSSEGRLREINGDGCIWCGARLEDRPAGGTRIRHSVGCLRGW